MEILVKSAILSFLPVSEVRGGIPFALLNGQNLLLSFFVCVVFNILGMFFAFFFLDYLHEHFKKIRLYDKFFSRYIERKKKQFEKHAGTAIEFLVLWLFVAIPLPFTGAYTGSIIAWLFKLNRKKAYLTISLGVLAAAVVVAAIVLTGTELFSIFIKR